MMSRALGPILQGLVLIGTMAGTIAGLGACGTLDDDPCREILHKTVVFAEPPDPSLGFQIETCRLDADACRDLCRTAMARAHLPGVLEDCDVTFTTATRTDVNVAYAVEVARPECPVEVFGRVVPDTATAPPGSSSSSALPHRALTGGSS